MIWGLVFIDWLIVVYYAIVNNHCAILLLYIYFKFYFFKTLFAFVIFIVFFCIYFNIALIYIYFSFSNFNTSAYLSSCQVLYVYFFLYIYILLCFNITWKQLLIVLVNNNNTGRWLPGSCHVVAKVFWLAAQWLLIKSVFFFLFCHIKMTAQLFSTSCRVLKFLFAMLAKL